MAKQFKTQNSEDDGDSLAANDSDSRSITPVTPVKGIDSSTQTTWTEDGVFKVPPVPDTGTLTAQQKLQEEEANIALRTRSKLSLSETPLEVLEGAFMPPDIDAEMYNMDCDDDVYSEFLRTFFTKPLDEVTKEIEDDHQDPEYNVLADAEIDNEGDGRRSLDFRFYFLFF